MNSQTPDQECLSDSYETDKAKTMLNTRYEELRTQILELGSVGPVGPLGGRKPLDSRPPSATATQWWERESGQIGKEFNLITQQGMVTWLQVWLDLKPMGDTDTDKNADADANTGTGSTGSPCKMLLVQRKKNIQPGQGPETRKKSNGEGGGTQDRGNRGDIILDCPEALVGVLSDIVCNAINLRQGSLKG